MNIIIDNGNNASGYSLKHEQRSKIFNLISVWFENLDSCIKHNQVISIKEIIVKTEFADPWTIHFDVTFKLCVIAYPLDFEKEFTIFSRSLKETKQDELSNIFNNRIHDEVSELLNSIERMFNCQKKNINEMLTTLKKE